MLGAWRRAGGYNPGVTRTPEKVAPFEPEAAQIAPAVQPCRVDRMPRRRRNQICVAIITIGALNFVVYTVLYAAVGGDAHNGYARVVEGEDGQRAVQYFVRGHFIRSLDGQEAEVSRQMWIYSYLHSISVFVTSAAMIISMLVLARPHILATMRDGWIGGQTFVRGFGVIVVLVTSAAVFAFSWDFIAQLMLE